MEKLRVKAVGTLDSRNFFVTFISIILLAASGQDVIFDQTPEEIYNLFQGQEILGILSIVVLNFLNPVTKLVTKIIKKQWSWDFVKSMNFQTQATSFVALILASWLGEELGGIVLALAVNVVNLIVHLAQKKPELVLNTA